MDPTQPFAPVPNPDRAEGGPAATACKRRKDSSRITYPRKRALRACEACRKRKVKCDNQKPSCGECQDLQIDCDFGDQIKDRSTYDSASLEILERLDYAVGLLQASQASNGPSPNFQDNALIETNGGYMSYQQHPTPGSLSFSEDNAKNDADILLESLDIAGRSPQVSEDILNWPIFEGKYDRSRTEVLIFNPHHEVSARSSHLSIVADPIRTSRPGRGIQDEDVPRLVEKFIKNVYIKNPVVDIDDIRSKTKEIGENGFSWDVSSCLVLIVCALGCISSTFTPELVTSTMVSDQNHLTSISDTLDYSTAESYYIASQKRISLLGNSILTTQCYFLSGVYEMYSLRPSRAWVSFDRAGKSWQIHLRGKKRKDYDDFKGVERRLYWACLKSECEIRMEIDLPSSGLSRLNYPDVFPSPPSRSPILSHAHTFEGTVDSRSSVRQTDEGEAEIIWCYYISEIAARRIGNRIMNCFYQSDEKSWTTMSLQRMIRIAEELELQLTQWSQNLPVVLARAPSNGTQHQVLAHELQFMLHARLFDFRERIYRPFLYLCLHHHELDSVQQTIAPYVQKCVDACIEGLLRGTPRHRHHGTWYENRGMFLKSLLLIAATKSRKVHIPSLWRQGIDYCIAGFKFWEQEAPDLREARLLLQSLLIELEISSCLQESELPLASLPRP